MTTKTISIIAFLVLLVHGIGHIQGIVAGFGVKFTNSITTSSWALKGLESNTQRILCLILYAVTAVFGILTALSYKDIMFVHSGW